MDIRNFKNAVGKFPTGVCVIATRYQDKLFGFTANSFTSVSLEPSLISFCLDKRSFSLQAFNSCSYFTVNILSSEQGDLSNHFAQTHKDKFQNINYELNAHQMPIINGCISTLECKKYNAIDCGDHVIFIGEAQNAICHEDKEPLIYYGRRYRELR